MSGEILQQSHVAPDLLSHLFFEYQKATGQFEPEHNAALVDGAKQFVEFANAYLSDPDNRPRHTFTADANVGVLLNNNVRVTLAPAVDDAEDIAGTMAPIAGVAVPVDVESVGARAYMSQGAVPISGFAKKRKDTIDYSDKSYGKKVVDLREPGKVKEFNTREGRVAHDPLNTRNG
jgi:hypothetical protein